MPLKISLKPKERAIIGGAVVANAGSKCELIIENDVPILREKEILGIKDADSPCKRIYFVVQLMYVDPERMDQHRATYGELVRDVVTAAPSTRELLNQINEHVEAGKYYPALKAARQLIDYEQELIRNVSQRP